MCAYRSTDTQKTRGKYEFLACNLSPDTCHLTTTLCRFRCYASPRRFGDAAVGGLVIDRVTNINKNAKPPLKRSFFLRNLRNNLFDELSPSLFNKMFTKGTEKQQTNNRQTLRLID